MVPTTDPMVDITILARDLLKPSLKLMLMLRLIPTFCTVMKTSIAISMGITITVQKVGISLSISISFRLGFGRSLAKIVVSSIGSVVGTIGIGVVKTRVHTGVMVSIGAVEKSGVSLSVSLGLGFS